MSMKNIKSLAAITLILISIISIWLIKNSQNIEADSKTAQSDSGFDAEQTNGIDFSLIQTEAIDYGSIRALGFPIIADYGSSSCVPCKKMAPILEKMNKEAQGKAIIKFVDVWKYRKAADNVPIQIIPSQILFNADGTPFEPSDELASSIKFETHAAEDESGLSFTIHHGGLTEEDFRKILKEMGVKLND